MRENEWDRETYIVQFVGPYKPEWLEAIKKEEGRIGKIAPTFSAVVKMSPLVKSKISQLPYVQWVGAYYPQYKMSSELLESEGGVRIAVMVFEASQRMDVSRRLVDMGVSVLMSYPSRTIIAYADSGLLPWIISIPEVLDVRRDFVSISMDLMSAKIHGAFDSWNTSRSGLPYSLTGQSPGPDGIEGTPDDYFEVVGIQDSGLDICDPDNGHPDLFKGPNGDRVIRLMDRTGNSCPDGWISGLSHGTQVVGTVIGNGFAWEYFFGYPTDDDNWEHAEPVGIVPEGKVSFDGIEAFGGGLLASPFYWDEQYADGAHVYVNAYGSQPADYGGDSWAVDERTDANNDRLMVFAAGNAGPDLNTLTSNSQGKNGLTSAAGLNFRPGRQNAHNPNLVGDFSGRGGDAQSFGRLKPDLVTVGTQAISLMGIGEWLHNEASGIGNPQDDCIMGVDVYNRDDPDNLTGDGICDYRYYEFGTSISTPNLGGLTMLVREYLREVGGLSDPYLINSQLVKALLINGAVRMDESLFDYPGYDQGWGSVDLVQSLFPPAPRTNR
ncbi:MAG: S8 family serine peptidase, partial [Thermoplasmata archaeon]|nr:S8 family serine peptidase [Thermoplasmata archaeon]